MKARETRRSGGFTLIEVVGALVIFTVGVLMTLNLSGATSQRLSRAAIQSELAAMAGTRIDSLSTAPLASLTQGTEQRYFDVYGKSYVESTVITSFSPLLLEIRVVLQPASGPGPKFFMTSYKASEWQ